MYHIFQFRMAPAAYNLWSLAYVRLNWERVERKVSQSRFSRGGAVWNQFVCDYRRPTRDSKHVPPRENIRCVMVRLNPLF